MKEREYNYDLLRAVSAFAVVLGHVAALFIETAQWDYFDGLPMNHPLISVVRCRSKACPSGFSSESYYSHSFTRFMSWIDILQSILPHLL